MTLRNYRPIITLYITEPPIIDINTSEPSYEEVRNAIRNLKSGKAPGIDSITAELLKADIEFSTRKVMNLLEKIWNKEEIPETWRKGLIIKLPKKGNLKKCKNWRGITLLPIVSKVLGRIIIDRIREGIDSRLRKEQAGFRKGRGTTETDLHFAKHHRTNK